MTASFSELELDALREIANVGSGTAATALSSMIGVPIDLAVPSAQALPLSEAVAALGNPEEAAIGVVLPVDGDVPGVVLLVFSPESAVSLCRLLGVELESEVGPSALAEIGNILGSAYVGALGTMTGIEFDPAPPQIVRDMLGAIASSALVSALGSAETVLLLDSELEVEGQACGFACVFVPSSKGVAEVLWRLGLGE